MAQWAYNPITGQLDRIGDGGDPAGNITITGDDGMPLVGDAFSIVGQNAGSAPMVTVDTTTGDVVIANNGYVTPYVVDQSFLPGLKGTFQTIQAALDAAFFDGMSETNPKVILIRPSETPYIENLAIHSGAYLMALNMSGLNAFVQPVIIQGAHAFPNDSSTYLKGISFISSLEMFTSGATSFYLLAEDCNFSASGINKILNSTAPCVVQFKNCYFGINADLDVEKFTTTTGLLTFENCNLNGSGITTQSTVTCNNCQSVGKVIINAGIPLFLDSEFTAETGNVVMNSAGTGGSIENCKFASNSNTNFAIEGTNPRLVKMFDCRIIEGSAGPKGFYDPSLETVNGSLMQVGNVINSNFRSDTDFIATGYEGYIGLTDTSAPRSVILKALTSNYYVYVVDEDGQAGTNNITVTVDGAGTINGAASDLISVDYGSKLYFSQDGTNFIVLNTSSGGVSSVTINPAVGAPLVGDNFNIYGGHANDVKTVETENDAGNLRIYDRTWQTQYVVDPEPTLGLQGTFDTIQAAINEAVIDGASISKQCIIYVRYGTYTENLVIPAGIFIQGNAMLSASGSIPKYTTIIGNHSFTDATVFRTECIHWVNPDANGDMFLSGAGILVNASFCIFDNGVSTGYSFELDLSGQQFLSCFFLGNAYQSIFNITAGSTSFIDCLFPSNCGVYNAANLSFLNCTSVGTVYNAGGFLSANKTSFNGDLSCILGTGSGVVLQQCQLNSTQDSINYSGPVSLSQCSLTDGDTQNMCIAGQQISVTPFQGGQIWPHANIDADSLLADSYINYVDSSAAPILIRLPYETTIDKTYVVKDATGNASINNVTVQVQSPGGPIDDQLTIILTQDFQCVCFQKTEVLGQWSVLWNTADGAQALRDSTGLLVGPSGGSIPVIGQFSSANAHVMDTYVGTPIGGDPSLVVENRTWFTQYVVDPSATPGQRATSTTIQDAINNAVADGVVSDSQWALIKVRPGTYTEDLILPADFQIWISGMTPPLVETSSLPSVIINGGITLAADRSLYLEAVSVNSVIVADCVFWARDCVISEFLGTSSALATIGLYNSIVKTVDLEKATIYMQNCVLEDAPPEFLDCSIDAIGCFFNTATCSVDGVSPVRFLDCDGLALNGTTTSTVSITNCGLRASTNTSGASRVVLSGNFSFVDRFGAESDLTKDLYRLTNQNVVRSTMRGNVILIKKVSANYTVTPLDQYIGVTSTAAPRVITLPDLSDDAHTPSIGQSFIIKDESGGASANNITINSAVAFIDGGTSVVIAVNYASVEIVFDGTNYFII